MTTPPPRVPGVRSAVVHLLVLPLGLALAAWLLQHSSLDVAISSLFFDAEQKLFVGKRSGVFELLGHQAARGLPIAVGVVALGVAVGSAFRASLRPWRARAIALAIALALTPSVISLLKSSTAAHCPHSVDVFGGQADYRAERDGPFWAASPAAAGRCLPSAHAGAGYALLALYFMGWAAGVRRWRWLGLGIGIVAGLLFSAVRISQGSHFASQTMWSAAVAWTIAALVFAPLLWGRRARARRATSAPA
jgi:membrane-associated PAP2 superfamily phosphatase